MTTASPQELVRGAIDRGEWPVYCLQGCEDTPASNMLDGGIIFSCQSCGTESPTIPYQWYTMSASRTLAYIMEHIPDVTARSARSWINNTKYTHPTYWHAQRYERDAAARAFHRVVLGLVDDLDISDRPARVLSVGCNNALELDYLPISWSAKDTVAVDVAAGALRAASIRYPGLKCVGEFAEAFSGESATIDGDDIGDQHGRFDLCLSLRTFQSSKFQLWSSLTRIRDALRPGGWLIISVPKKTALLSGNMHPGIWTSNHRFDEQLPKRQAEDLAKELTSGSEMYANVALHYGIDDDAEYYITAQRMY